MERHLIYRGSRMTKKSTLTEAQEQILLSTWLTKSGIRHSASANGEKRNLYTGLKLKRMGVSAGYPDIEIQIPRKPYHGLFLELKRESGGILSSAQRDWLAYLQEKRYFASCASGFEEAKSIITRYLTLPEWE